MKNDKLREIPLKNYMILGIVMIVSFLLVYYMYMWSSVYDESKLNVSIMDKYLEVINYNELDDYLVENIDVILYVSVLENEDIRNFEKKFKNVVKGDDLNKEILYMNITDDIKDDKKKSEMEKKYMVNSLKITDVPAILVFDGGSLKSIYSISDNDYDIERVKTYINNIKFSDGDILND